jgi:hypothetical protein
MYGFQSPPIASPGKEVATRMAAASRDALIVVYAPQTSDETISLIRQTSANDCTCADAVNPEQNKHVNVNQAARTARTEFGGLL